MVTKHSDFDDYTRSRIFALMAIEAKQCDRCGNYDTLVPLRDSENDERTTVHDGREFAVQQFRCITCALKELVEREARRAAKDEPEPGPGKPANDDGRMFMAIPTDGTHIAEEAQPSGIEPFQQENRDRL